MKDRQGVGAVVQEDALGDLKLETIGREAGLGKDLADPFDQGRRGELHR